MISWIDDNMILGPSNLVMQIKNDLMKQFECNDCGRLEEYVGNKMTTLAMMPYDSLKMCLCRVIPTSLSFQRGATTLQHNQGQC